MHDKFTRARENARTRERRTRGCNCCVCSGSPLNAAALTDAHTKLVHLSILPA